MDEKQEITKSVNHFLRGLIDWLLVVPASIILIAVETYQPIITFALALLAVYFILNGIQGRLTARRTGLVIPLFLFVLSAGIAVLISYNQVMALLQFSRLLAAAALYFAIAQDVQPFPKIVAAGFLTAAAGLGLYWILKHDYILEPGKLSWITTTGIWLNARFPIPPGPIIHKNIAGATLLLAAPFGPALIRMTWKLRQPVYIVATALLTSAVFFGLLMTSSFGAWLGVFATFSIAVGALAQIRWLNSGAGKPVFWAGLLLIFVVIVLILILSGTFTDLVGQIPNSTGTVSSRIDFWRDGLSLIHDYVFTGSGLQSFLMVHALYARLTDVPYIPSSHNSFLQVWIEQGFWGALALTWGTIVIVLWAWKGLDRSDTPILGWAGIAALFAAAVHGLVDVTYYIGQTLPAVGIPFGFAALVRVSNHSERAAERNHSLAVWAGVAVLAALIVVGVIYRKPLIAAWYANIGALEQTHQELSLYNPEHFDDPPLEEVRRTADLRVAIDNFRSALSYQPHNRTALQRLAMISLSRHEYSNAMEMMQTAWDAGHHDAVTRFLFSDTLVANDDLQRAAELVRDFPWATERLFSQAWYRYWLNQDYRRAANAWQTILYLDPSYSRAAEYLEKAQKKLQP